MIAVDARAVAAVAVASRQPFAPRSATTSREIRLVVRDMTYYAAHSQPRRIPTLRLARGEKIRLVLTNDDPGYSHNLIAPELGVSTPLLAQGESQSIEIHGARRRRSSTAMSCGPHSRDDAR